jgi:rod shape-determining protein MreB
VIVERNIETGGNSIDEAIVSFVKMKHGMLIGRVTAEKIKLRLDNMVIRGRDLESGLPKSVMIGVAETSEAIALELTKIVRTLRSVLDEAPPEITNEVVKQGILLVGRGALTKGLKMMIETETRINCLPVDDGPGMAVIKGLAMLVEDKDLRERVKLVSGYGS